MASVLAFTVVGSYTASLVPAATMGGFAVFMTFLLGVKFILRPVMTTKEAMQGVSAKSGWCSRWSAALLSGLSAGLSGRGAA